MPEQGFPLGEAAAVPDELVLSAEMPVQAVVLYERRRRHDALQAAANYWPPLPRATELGALGPEDYADAARVYAREYDDGLPALASHAALEGPLHHDEHERRQLEVLVDEYLEAHPAALEEVTPGGLSAQNRRTLQSRMTRVLRQHVHGFAALPRLVMDGTYLAARGEVISRYIDEAPEAFMAGERVLRRTEVQELHDEISALRYDQRLPDLLRLPLEDQRAVVAMLCDDGVDLFGIIMDRDPGFFSSPAVTHQTATVHSPLWSVTPNEIADLFVEYPDVPPRDILSAVWRSPLSFRTDVLQSRRAREVGALMDQRDVEARRAAAYESYATDMLDIFQDRTLNQHLRDMAPGLAITLTQPGQPVRRVDARGMLERNLRYLAYDRFVTNPELAVDAERFPPEIVVEGDVLSQLVPHRFHGDLHNLTLIELPIDREFMQRHVPDLSGLAPNSLRRIGIGVEMHSTGRSPIQAEVEALLYIARDEQNRRTRLVRMVLGPDAAARAAIRDLIAEARTNALMNERYARTHLYRGGLPGTGRR